LRSNQLCLFTP